MKITYHINSDYKSLKSYFNRMFVLLEETKNEEWKRAPKIEDYDTDVSHAKFYEFSHLIKPDMLLNIYSFIDYWLPIVCDYKQSQKSLELQYKDVKGNDDLHAHHKYLTKYAKLDLCKAEESYMKLQNLRKVRNKFIHNGGHVPNENQSEFDSMDGVSISGTLIIIEDKFIWSCIGHASNYLQVATTA